MNLLEVFAARNGDPTARWGTRQLHSRFDPRVEAERFLDSSSISISVPPRLFVVIGAGFGYLIAAIRLRFPGSRVLSLALHPELSRGLVEDPDALWTPEATTTLSEFLSVHISDLATSSLAVLEWTPVVEAFPAEAQRVRTELSEHVRRSHASLVTQGASGRRWLRNRLFNYVRATPVRHAPSDAKIRAVVLVAAGPSLEDSLPHIVAQRETVEVWVTGSALDAVAARGIRPDVVVVTDAAPYASEHIRAIQTGSMEGVPVAAPLGATRGIAHCKRVLVMSEGDSVDHALLGADKSTPTIPPHGTVTATCALLIRALTPAPIIVIGSDFAWAAHRSHARPHLSEVYRRKDDSRLIRASTRVFESARLHEQLADDWTTSQTLRTYAQWFESEGVRRCRPVYSLCPSPMLSEMPSITPEGVAELPARFAGIRWESLDWGPPGERARTARTFLLRAKETVARTEQPSSASELESTSSQFAELAVRLCLPDLLRWNRTSGAARQSAWEQVVAALTAELDSCLEIVA